MLRTIGAYGLVEEGDRILVAVSGGKDSYTMLDLLWAARRKSPVPYEIVAVHLDQKLVQCLLTLVVATAIACATVATDGVDLVDEDDARLALLPLLKEIPDA